MLAASGMRRLVVLVLFSLISAAPAPAAEKWLRITSPHFEMLTTAGERDGREGVLYFETVRQFFINAGIARNLPDKRVRLVAFRGDKEFRPYAPNDFATAFYVGADDYDYIVLSQIGFEYDRSAVHEYTHLVHRHSFTKLPLWLDEGTAEFFSTLRPEGSKVAVGEIIPGHVMEMEQNRLIDLKTLFAINHESSQYNERSHAGMLYAESWALVHMLFASPGYNAHFRVFMDLMEAGQSSEASLQQAFGKSVADVQRDLSVYFHTDYHHHLDASVKLDEKAGKPDVQPVDTWDADLVLADIMATSQRKAEMARTMLTQLMTEQPKRPEPPAMMAELALREGHGDEARGFYAKAAELGDTNPEMYYRYAMLLWSRSANGDDDVIKALRKAVELNPGYIDAHLRLGLALLDHSDYKGSLAELKQIHGIKSSNAFTYFHAVAYANYRLGDAEMARAALERAKQFASLPADRIAVDQLTSAIDTEVTSGVTPTEATAETVQTVQAPAHLPKMAGTLDTLECSPAHARLSIVAAGKTTWFLLDDPAAVRMSNAGGRTLDFTCGKQAARAVVIEYKDRPDDETKTVGLVRGIEFQ